jgi:hypothetical protein
MPPRAPLIFSQCIRICCKTHQVSGGGASSGQLNAAPEPGATPNGPSGGGLLGSGTAGSGAALSANAKAAAEAPPTLESAAATAACQAALVQSPAASRAALANHRAAIDPALAKILEIVGGYTCAVFHFNPPPLLLSQEMSGSHLSPPSSFSQKHSFREMMEYVSLSLDQHP